jgi:hypothetical protein
MGYRLQMSAEIHDWLTELRGSDPSTAVLAGLALAALAEAGDRLGPPLVVAVPSRLAPEELPSALDRRYQAWLDSTTATRRRVAEAATLRKDIERQLTRPEHAQAPAALQERFAAAAEAEERLTAASQREQMLADAFRFRKEALKGAYIAAQVRQLLAQDQDDGDEAVQPDDPAGATATLAEVTSQIERELGPEAPAEGLMELRPGATAGSDIRVLFAVEPPGTALLIAVLEGGDAVQDHYHEAVLLASGVLREARAGQAADATAHEFAGAHAFLEEFFPGHTAGLHATARLMSNENP